MAVTECSLPTRGRHLQTSRKQAKPVPSKKKQSVLTPKQKLSITKIIIPILNKLLQLKLKNNNKLGYAVISKTIEEHCTTLPWLNHNMLNCCLKRLYSKHKKDSACEIPPPPTDGQVVSISTITVKKRNVGGRPKGSMKKNKLCLALCLKSGFKEVTEIYHEERKKKKSRLALGQFKEIVDNVQKH